MTDTSPQIPPPLDRPRRPPSRVVGHLRAIVALILREMSSRYGRSPGGYVWAVLEPLGMILVLSFGFALLLRSPSLGNSFLLFYATGYLPYIMFQRTAMFVMNSMNFSRALLRYPAVTWIDAVLARALLNILTEMLVAYILLMGVLIAINSQTVLEFGPILGAFAQAALLGVGVGMINCVMVGFFPIWQNIWSIVTRPLFLASGVIWIYSELPDSAQAVLWWNPLVHILGYGRTGFYPTYEPQYISHVFVMTICLSTVAMGLLLLRRFHLRILERR